MVVYFRPWPRKLGMIMLATTCVFLAGWMRSYVKQDILTVRCGGSIFQRISSHQQRIAWARFSNVSRKWRILSDLKSCWKIRDVQVEGVEDITVVGLTQRSQKWCFQRAGFTVHGGNGASVSGINYEVWEAPYWTMVAAMTLISAFLLQIQRLTSFMPTKSGNYEDKAKREPSLDTLQTKA